MLELPVAVPRKFRLCAMLLDLSRIRSATQHIARVYEPSAIATPDDQYSILEPVKLAADVHKAGERFRVVGRVQSTLELPCSRCVEAFQLPVDLPFDVRFLPHTENTGEGEVAVAEDELDTTYYRDDTIDLGQLAREQFYLALPMKPLCRAECRGLCPVCGTNLNRDTCDCNPLWEDPRLAPLKSLIKPDMH